MISVLYPDIIKDISIINYGLIPYFIPTEKRFVLIFKIFKEGILTATTNNQFKIYFIKDPINPNFYCGIITAFFDDHDEPYIVATLPSSQDCTPNDIVTLLSQKEFELYFFDEHNREIIGTKATNIDYKRFKANDFSAKISPCATPDFNAIENICNQFSLRTEEDDRNAFTIILSERLYPDDFIIIDLREKFYGFNDSERTIATTSLIRGINPGVMQERDIALLFRRIFDKKYIYLNPYRADTNNEIADILIATEKHMILVQAKDNPNTSETLKRTIKRKRETIRKQIKKASGQLKGALKYVLRNNGVAIKENEDFTFIHLNERQLVGLVIVQELFDDDFVVCSEPILNLVYQLDLPIVLLDYPQLHILTKNLKCSKNFISGLYKILDVAIENGMFPRSVYSTPKT